MKRAKLNFGERMREWRKARREYADTIKKKIKEKQDVEDTYPKIEAPVENKVMNLSPEQQTEAKSVEIRYIEKPNHIEAAINHLRSKIIQ